MWRVETLWKYSIYKDGFEEACKELIRIVRDLLVKGQLTYHQLEKCMWIKECIPDKAPMYFPEVRDICIRRNWIDKTGNWIAKK